MPSNCCFEPVSNVENPFLSILSAGSPHNRLLFCMQTGSAGSVRLSPMVNQLVLLVKLVTPVGPVTGKEALQCQLSL